MGFIIDSMSHNSFKKHRNSKSFPAEERVPFTQNTIRADEARSLSHEREWPRGSQNTRNPQWQTNNDNSTNEVNLTALTDKRFQKVDEVIKPELNSIYGQSKANTNKPRLPPLNTVTSPSNSNLV